MEVTSMAERKINRNSLENLKMGAIARNQGKLRVTLTILPETKRWLASGGNMSERLDDMVRKVLKGDVVFKRSE